MKLPKYKTLPFGIQIKGGFSTHKYSSRCPRLTLSSKPRALWWPCCVYLSRTSWSITPKLGWTRMSWRLVSWLLKIKLRILLAGLTNLTIVFQTESSWSDVLCAKTLQWHDECGQTSRLWGTSQELWSSFAVFLSGQRLGPWKPQRNHLLCVLCLSPPRCRGRSRPRANCSNRTPSPSQSRTAASSPEQRKDGSSFSSSW